MSKEHVCVDPQYAKYQKQVRQVEDGQLFPFVEQEIRHPSQKDPLQKVARRPGQDHTHGDHKARRITIVEAINEQAQKQKHGNGGQKSQQVRPFLEKTVGRSLVVDQNQIKPLGQLNRGMEDQLLIGQIFRQFVQKKAGQKYQDVQKEFSHSLEPAWASS